MLTASNSSGSPSTTKEEALLVAAKVTFLTFNLVVVQNEKLNEALRGGERCLLGWQIKGFEWGRWSKDDDYIAIFSVPLRGFPEVLDWVVFFIFVFFFLHSETYGLPLSPIGETIF